MICESFSLSAEISYSAISASRSAGVHMQSPITLRTKTVLPAPIKVIFIMNLLYKRMFISDFIRSDRYFTFHTPLYTLHTHRSSSLLFTCTPRWPSCR